MANKRTKTILDIFLMISSVILVVLAGLFIYYSKDSQISMKLKNKIIADKMSLHQVPSSMPKLTNKQTQSGTKLPDVKIKPKDQ